MAVRWVRREEREERILRCVEARDLLGGSCERYDLAFAVRLPERLSLREDEEMQRRDVRGDLSFESRDLQLELSCRFADLDDALVRLRDLRVLPDLKPMLRRELDDLCVRRARNIRSADSSS